MHKCTSCDSRVDVKEGSGTAHCSECGADLELESLVGDTTIEDVEPSLVVELREAFAVGAECAVDVDLSSIDTIWRRTPGSGLRLGDEGLGAGGRLGDFQIVNELGRGGMGIVYRAKQMSLGREVALKVLPNYGRHGRTSLRRFRAEAQAAARLNHSNIVPVYAQGDCDGHYFYAMELVEGTSLDTVMKTHPELLSSAHATHSSSIKSFWRSAAQQADARTSRASASGFAGTTSGSHAAPAMPKRRRDDYCHMASLLAGVADGLAHAHAHGVIHRDVKPHNLIFGNDHQLHLTDFGLAHIVDEPHLTISGEVMGTPAYLSPEQARGEVGAINERTDVYSLGVTLYELITRQRPFQGETRHQIIDAVLRQEPRRPRRVEARIPVDLETICLRAIEKEPRGRYASAADLAEDLRRFAEGRPILSRRFNAVEKAAKLVRRHKAVASAVAVSLALLTVSTGWAASIAAKNRKLGNDLLRSAYDNLVHTNFDRTEEATDNLSEAEAFGADDSVAEIVRAIVEIRDSEAKTAIDRLSTLLAKQPENTEAMYLLAWAQRRLHRNDKAMSTLQRADELGGPKTAEVWFFRGLALQRDDAAGAVDSYETASKTRSAQNLFFPQADRFIALGINQLMYETLSLDRFDEAESYLKNLILREHYGGYAYYLLSTTYWIAAEIYNASSDPQDAEHAQELLAEALRLARKGQLEYPNDNRPVTAEAVCLESQGKLEMALSARTRAIELAYSDEHTSENLHFRWRLHYWLGQLEDAMDDIEAYKALLPESAESVQAARLTLLYTDLFPALVHADGGDIDSARALVRAAGDVSGVDPQAVLLIAAFMRILGAPDEAHDLLLRGRDRVDFSFGLQQYQTAEWIETLYAYALGEASFAELEQLAVVGSHPHRLMGDGHFQAGVQALATGDRVKARTDFDFSYRSLNGSLNYSYIGRLLLRRLADNLDWPGWISVIPGGDGNVGYSQVQKAGATQRRRMDR